MSLFEELKKRNLFRVAAGYIIIGWALMQIADTMAPALQLPDWIVSLVAFLLILGFPLALFLAWAYEMTPQGLRKESDVDRDKSGALVGGRKLDVLIIGVLVLIVGYLLVDKFYLQTRPEAAPAPSSGPVPIQSAGAEPGDQPGMADSGAPAPTSVAVLPLAVLSSGPDDDYFADGLTEEIINALSQLPELLVTARTSSFHFKGLSLPIGEIAAKLGVEHVVEGSVRRAGSQLRITAQLVRANDGFHLWSETYDRRTEDTLAVQEDIAEKVASALDVILDKERREQMREAGVRNVEAFVAYQKGFELYARAHSGGNMIRLLRRANEEFENAVALAPDFTDAYLNHADLHSHIVMDQAAGLLNGEITPADVERAPVVLREDYDQAIRSAKRLDHRRIAEFDRALLLGEWHGLKVLNDEALAASGCEIAQWTPLSSAPFGSAAALRDMFIRKAVCDPLFPGPHVHIVRSDLWLGQPQRAIQAAQKSLETIDHPWLAWTYSYALAMTGRHEEAGRVAASRLRAEQDRLAALSMLATMRGDGEEGEALHEDLLAGHGPNDQISLILEAARGNRNEANRLATVIDRRPFGYLALMRAIYFCLCGAPFDLEAAPVFASMLSESGLPWPPLEPFDLPLKDW